MSFKYYKTFGPEEKSLEWLDICFSYDSGYASLTPEEKKDLKELEDWAERIHKRKTYVFKENDAFSTADEHDSWIGRVTKMQRGEEWPLFSNKPMIPLFQLRIADLPFVPDQLQNLAYITCFVSSEIECRNRDVFTNGDGWLLRCYPNLESLCEAEDFKGESILVPMSIAFEEHYDFPSDEESLGSDGLSVMRKYYEFLCKKHSTGTSSIFNPYAPENLSESNSNTLNFKWIIISYLAFLSLEQQIDMNNHFASKLGGWPMWVQYVAPVDMLLQLAFERKNFTRSDVLSVSLLFSGSGVITIGTSHDENNEWILVSQRS